MFHVTWKGSCTGGDGSGGGEVQSPVCGGSDCGESGGCH